MITEKEFEQLFDEHVDDVATFLYTYSSDHAQVKDWVQDVFTKLWRSREKIDFSHAGFKTYLFTTARNHALKKLQTQKRYSDWLDQNLLRLKEQYSEESEQNDSTGTSEIEKVHNKALSQIPSRSRQAYLLSREEGLTYKETAKVMDISVKTVEAHIRKSLQILRKELKNYTKQ